MSTFAGCATDDVLGAIGLTFSDLYPPRPIANTSAERAQVRQSVRESQWAAALTTIARDTLLVQAAAGMLARGEPLPASNLDALTAAAARIHLADPGPAGATLLAICDDLDDLREEIHVTLVHEIAHFYGIDDDELHRLGWA